jgi:hypothetical protein
MRYALIKILDGLVENVIELSNPADWNVPNGYQLLSSETASVGDTWNGEEFIKPEPSPEDITAQKKAQAQGLLNQTDITIIRCYEKGVEVPLEWQSYRDILRSIAYSGVGDIPEMPDYPEGS